VIAVAAAPEARNGDAARALGQAAYPDYDREVEVLELTYDSVVDAPEGVTDEVRVLRFAGPDCTVQLVVHGRRHPTVELAVSPAGPLVVVARTPGVTGRQLIVLPQGHAVIPVRSQLTSFVLRWPHGEHRPARTAWVLL
jgi:hypothetical protein